MDFNFILGRHDRELDRKDRLTAAVALPVSILAALGGAVATMARGFSYGPGRLSIAFGIALSIDVAATALCLYWLARNYTGSTYVYLPRLGELETARTEWAEFYEAAKQGGAEEDFFKHEFERRIIEATDANAATNDSRTAYIDRANQTLVAVLIAAAVCGGIYVLDQIR